MGFFAVLGRFEFPAGSQRNHVDHSKKAKAYRNHQITDVHQTSIFNYSKQMVFDRSHTMKTKQQWFCYDLIISGLWFSFWFRELRMFLVLNGVLLTLIHVLFIFFASPKKTNQKKRAPCLGIFCLIRQKPLCQLRVAIAPVLRSFLQLFWTKGI